MADFCITAVRYNDEGTHLSYVKVREDRKGNPGAARVVSRAFIADLIRLGKATFITRVEKKDGSWMEGAAVHIIDGKYLTTDKNSIERDNLENLPEF
ncbi:MAG TPA: DUF3892 domain-containing protein [Desulfovibrio sp.]|uniref:DUF3892 domain-containing protein n=1 Tax=Desulfovibrio sp. TaxID=885 RepID=UPI002D612086|nr:DUF3892 domain-containing protein [Desulfovibrio sp.]HZF62740.1 DUF3892 domain-containing protein [Desulfovibrio sp.]